SNEALSYVIYVDNSRYTLVKEETRDIISPNPALNGDYPEVSMEISKKENTTREQEINFIKKELSVNKMVIKREEDVNTPLEATLIHAIKGNPEEGETDFEWDTPVIDYFVTKEIKGQFFIIKQTY